MRGGGGKRNAALHGGRVENHQKLRNVINGRPLIDFLVETSVSFF